MESLRQDARGAAPRFITFVVREPAPPDVFHELFHVHAPALRRFAQRIVRSRETAEDVVQEVFLRLWLSRDRVEVGAGTRSYLYIATRARALDHLKRERADAARRDAAHDDGAEPSRGAEGDSRVLDEEIAGVVERVLAGMPPRQREVAVLRLRGGLSTAEAARTLGISPRTVELHVARAMRVLRERLPALLPDDARTGGAGSRAGARGSDDAPMTRE